MLDLIYSYCYKYDMNLNEYFTKYTTDHIAATAKKAGTSLEYLRGCRCKQRRMSADIAIRLEHASNGLMTARELRPDLPWPEPAATRQPSIHDALHS